MEDKYIERLEERKQRFEKHFLLIRRSLGWSAVQFGERIGVSRQTINNIESGRSKMSKTEYLLIRRILDEEFHRHPRETKMTLMLLIAIIDSPEKVSEKEREEILSKAEMLAPAIIANPSDRQKVSDTLVGILIGGGVVVAAGIVAALKNKK